MADAEPMQGGVERQFPLKRAAPPVHETERRRHGRQVELDTRQVGVGRDAAVGDDQGLAAGEQRNLVRADAMGRKLAQALVPALHVVDADDAALALEVVLGGVEQPPVQAEDAVPIEMSVDRRFYASGDGAQHEVQNQGEAAGAPGEMHGSASVGAHSERMAPRRQRQIEERSAVLSKAADPVAAGDVGVGTEIERGAGRGGLRAEQYGWDRPGDPTGEQQKRVSAINPHRGH